MNQNSTVDNDLQKAIDDITNNTNTDPVFSDPVAAPSSVPEGDDGTLAEPVGPFPEPQPVMPAPATPFDATNAPSLDAPTTNTDVPNYDYYTTPVPPEPTTETIAEPIVAPEPVVPNEIVPEPPAPAIETTPHTNLGMHQVKEAALRDLVPIMDKISLSPSQKFRIYRDMFENLRDYTVLEPAYRAASEIADEHERAEALLYLIESIDRM